jgi:hypothetical protein
MATIFKSYELLLLLLYLYNYYIIIMQFYIQIYYKLFQL